MKSATFDFLFPTFILLVDSAPWSPITVGFGGVPIKIHKPIVEQSTHAVSASIGNQGLDASSTILRLELSSEAPPDGHQLYPLALLCLSWIRVLTRQYWIGFSGSGTASVRGSSLTTDLATGEATPTNFGAFSSPIIPEVLSEELWRHTAQAVAAGQIPRTSDLILCNGMLALRDGNLRESIALLGIACESELGECLQGLLSGRNDEVASLLFEGSRQGFNWKLNKLLPALSGRDFSKDEPHWHSELTRLYEARGTAAHSGLPPEVKSRVPRFLHAANSFLIWTHNVRSSKGESLGPCPLALRATLG